jgi:hypothetical protein
VSRVFQSHSSRDSIEALALKAWLEPTAGRDITSEWQRCDLFGDGPETVIEVGPTESVEFLTAGLVRLQKGLRAAGISPDTFAWPPEGEPDRAPYRGVADLAAATADGSPRAALTSHSTRIHPLSGTRVLGRWHAATIHFLCP